jgi:hypothetical protein
VKTSPSQQLNGLFLKGVLIWTIADRNTPTDIPTEGNWESGADLTIPGDGTPQSFVIQFQNPVRPPGYEIHLVFDTGCQVVGTQ